MSEMGPGAKNIGRRKFLELASKTVVQAVAVGIGLDKALEISGGKTVPKAVENVKAVSTTVTIPAVTPQSTPEATSTSKSAEQPIPKPLPTFTPEYASSVNAEELEYLKGYEEKIRANVKLIVPDENQVDDLRKGMDLVGKELIKLHIEDENQNKRDKGTSIFDDTLKHAKTADRAANDLGYDEHSPIRAFVKGLIFQESMGDPNASSGVALGLCQIKPETAQAMLRKLKEYGRIPILNKIGNSPNLFDPYANAVLALEYIDELHDMFPDYGLSIWAYHLGQGNMMKVIAAAIGYSSEATDRLVDVDISDPKKDVPGTIRKAVTGEEGKPPINFVAVRTNKEVNSRWDSKNTGKWKNGADIYVPHIIAATVLMT